MPFFTLAPAAPAPGESAVLPTKRVTMALGAPNTTSAAVAVTDWAERMPIVLPIKTKRWRLKVANRNLQNAGVALTTPMTISDIYAGLPANVSTGRFTGAYGAAPSKVADGGAIPTNGTDWVSAWVEDPAKQFGPDGEYGLIGWRLTSPGGGTGIGMKSTRYGFVNSAAGAANTLGVTAGTGYAPGGGALDVRLEYEFEGNNPVGLYVGASNDEGYNVNEDAGWLCMAHEAWPGAYGLAAGVPWVNAAIAGAQQQPFQNAGGMAYSRFDLATTQPDFAVINLGGNSINNSVSLTTIQNQIVAVYGALWTLGVKRWFLGTMQPAGYPGGDAKETARNAYNAWVRTLPSSAQGVVDFDLVMRNPSAPNQLRPEYALADGVHFNRAGHQWQARQVGALR